MTGGTNGDGGGAGSGALDEAMFGDEADGECDSDLPRSPFTPSPGATADLRRRVAQSLRAAWPDRIASTLTLAARLRAESPGAWPAPVAATRAELLAELVRLRPGQMATAFAREVEHDDDLLAAVVDAYGVLDRYRRAWRAEQR